MKIYIVGSVSSGKSTFAKKMSETLRTPYQSLDEVVYIPDKSNPWGNRKRQIAERDNLFYSVIQPPEWIIEDAGKDKLKDRISPYQEKVITLRSNRDINRIIRFYNWGINKMNYVEDLRKIVGHRPLILVGAVTIIIDDKKRILLQKRKSTSYGMWGLPGGLMELGESTEDTARREVLEETGLKIGKLNLIDVFSGPEDFLKVPNGDEFYSVTVAYYTKQMDGDLIIDESESLGFNFIDIKKLPVIL